ncbi:hypothetical protein F5Y16DRAFT_386106 [Xylariaceae sp. FL0255]|nr:hypothetical protein F5Y16DRAFT_386106 [Xylariaceae sp. FL0255]
MSAPADVHTEEYTRLHITPFDESLLRSVLSASILPRARNISYHTIETFPEKPFGFVDLPTMDADKLKKKLNGAVLKGKKLRVETARPEKIQERTQEEDNGDDSKERAKKEKKKSKKRKHEINVIEGVELEGRKIKRGWTTTENEMIEEKRKKAKREKKDEKVKEGKKDKKEKRRDVKSKYTDGPECLFKTKLPMADAPKEKDEDGPQKKKRKRKGEGEVIVHEFEKTVKYPSFLKSSYAGGTVESATFHDGVGWVDSDGNVVEAVKKTKRLEAIPPPKLPKTKRPTPAAPVTETADNDEEDSDETSSSGTSSSGEDEESDEDSEASAEEKEATPAKPLQVVTNNPSSPLANIKSKSARPKSSGSITTLSIKIPPPVITTTPAAKKAVHPLEALYKRSKDETPSNAEQPFSFFSNDNDDEDMKDGGDSSPRRPSQSQSQMMPMTPFTKQDFDFRNIRSAAPTPDTAHPSRSFNFFGGRSKSPPSDDEADASFAANRIQGAEELGNVVEEDEGEGVAEAGQDVDIDMQDGEEEKEEEGAEEAEKSISDFQKQFWEKRGDLNRAWRKRRKMASKEKRYRENRARADRAI